MHTQKNRVRNRNAGAHGQLYEDVRPSMLSCGCAKYQVQVGRVIWDVGVGLGEVLTCSLAMESEGRANVPLFPTLTKKYSYERNVT